MLMRVCVEQHDHAFNLQHTWHRDTIRRYLRRLSGEVRQVITAAQSIYLAMHKANALEDTTEFTLSAGHARLPDACSVIENFTTLVFSMADVDIRLVNGEELQKEDQSRSLLEQMVFLVPGILVCVA